MARSDFFHYDLLNRWPIILHEDPWRFNQLLGDGVRRNDGCDDKPYLQYQRDFIATALGVAGYDVARFLGFYPRPVWITGERVNLNLGSCWDCQNMQAKFGWIQAFGTRAVTLIEADVAVVYTDSHQSGVLDRATITVNTAIDPSEIQIFFRVADGAESAASEQWQITPLKIASTGSTATITGHRALFANPELWSEEYTGINQNERNAGNLNTPQDFIESVDIYHVYTDSSNGAQVISDPRESVVINQPVTAAILDSKNAWFGVSPTIPTDPAPEHPLAVEINYLAGYPLQNGLMNQLLESAVIRLANTPNYMPTTPRSFCDATAVIWYGDREIADDASITSFQDRTALGVTNGALAATQIIRAMRIQGLGEPFPDEINAK